MKRSILRWAVAVAIAICPQVLAQQRGRIVRPTSAPAPGEPDNGLTTRLPNGIVIARGTYLHATPGTRPGTEVFDTPMAYYTATRALPGTGLQEQDFLEGPGYVTQVRAMSWLYWWELNQERYLFEARSRRESPVPAIEPTPAAAKALLAAAQSKNATIRREAILTLGRIKQSGSLDILEKATKDPDDICRLRAWTSIGLLDTPEAMTFLEAPPPKTQIDRIGWTVGVGMLTEPTTKLWQTLREYLVDPQYPEAQRLAVRAITSHHKYFGREALLDALRVDFADSVLDAIVQCLGEFQDPRDIPNLIALAQPAPDGCEWPAIRTLYQAAEADKRRQMVRSQGIRGASRPETSSAELRLRMLRRPAFLSLAAYGKKLSDPGIDAVRKPIVRDISNITLLNDKNKRQMLLTGGGLSNPLTKELGVQDCCILGVGGYGTGDDVEILRVLMGMGNPAAGPMDDVIATFAYDSRRGVAAIAMGIYLHDGGMKNEQTFAPSAATGRPTLPAEDALNNLYQQETALNSFRAACALAMAMSGNEPFTRLIKQPLQRLRPGQEPVFGYALTAMGMLGDKEAIQWFAGGFEPAQKQIDVARLASIHSSNGLPAMSNRELMARRAAIQGMAALGDPAAIPSLIAQWGYHPLLDTEIARAILWCRRPPFSPAEEDFATNFGESLAQLASQEKSPTLAATAAASLGHFFDRGGRIRLAALIENTDWEMLAFPLPPARRQLYYSPQAQVVSMANPFYPATLRPLTLHDQLPDRLIYYQGNAIYLGGR